MMTAVVLLLAATLAEAATAAPQNQSRLGSIEGYVLRAGTNEPVYRAQVSLIRADPPAVPNTTPQMPKTAMTDKSGHFVFSNVEAARYTVRAQRNGYVVATFGQRSLSAPGTALVLGPGQAMKDVIFRMTPAALVTGRISDAEAEPIVGAEVALVKAAYDINGQKTLAVQHSSFTNDLGEYRLYWVSPGKYYLQITYSGTSLYPLGRNPNIPMLGGDDVYVPTFYPGTTDASRAGLIEILAGAHVGRNRTGRVSRSRVGPPIRTTRKSCPHYGGRSRECGIEDYPGREPALTYLRCRTTKMM